MVVGFLYHVMSRLVLTDKLLSIQFYCFFYVFALFVDDAGSTSLRHVYCMLNQLAILLLSFPLFVNLSSFYLDFLFCGPFPTILQGLQFLHQHLLFCKLDCLAGLQLLSLLVDCLLDLQSLQPIVHHLQLFIEDFEILLQDIGTWLHLPLFMLSKTIMIMMESSLESLDNRNKGCDNT